MKQFMLDMKAVDRDNEVNRVLWAFKLNPFEKLDLRFTATAAEVKTAYRCATLSVISCKQFYTAICRSLSDRPMLRNCLLSTPTCKT